MSGAYHLFEERISLDWGAEDASGRRPIMLDGSEVGHIDFGRAIDEGVSIRIFSLKPGLTRQGLGTRVLEDICRRADEAGCDLYLEAFWRSDKEDGGWLVCFYRRQGFEVIDGPNMEGYVEMSRTHRCPALEPGL